MYYVIGFLFRRLVVLYHIIAVIAAILLLFTFVLKLIGIFVSVPLLNLPDPIFGLRFRTIIVASAVLELLVALYLIIGRNELLKTAMLTVLGSGFVAYHGTRALYNLNALCPCLGSASDWIGLSNSIVERVAFAIAVILFGSGNFRILIEMYFCVSRKQRA